MKNVKMLGLVGQLFSNVQALRDSEMETSKRYETIQALTVSLGKRRLDWPKLFCRVLIET